MACNATRLCVVDLKRRLSSDLCKIMRGANGTETKNRTSSLDVEEVDVVRGGVYHSPEGHGVGNLSMEPDVFIGREQPSELGTDDTDDVAKHRKENETSGIGENKTGPTRRPDREFEAIQNVKFLVRFLTK